MFAILANRAYASLFAAQVVALLGSGLLTVALGLLAFDLAGDRAGAVLGTAFAIKMVAYVGISPIASAVTASLPRKYVLVGADLVRVGVAACLPFIDAIWQVYGLIFVLQAASATFTPVFQATIPDILPEEKDYTNALSLSRLAYDLESLLSPALAGLLLTFMSYHWLFGGTAAGFVVSAALVTLTVVPTLTAGATVRPFKERLTRGSRIYLATPRLRGLLALNLTAASVGAFILVNTIVMVRSGYRGSEQDVAFALAAFGGGSMVAAFLLPRLLERLADRTVMSIAAALIAILTMAHAGIVLIFGLLDWGLFLAVWAVSGFLYSAILTPSGRLLRRSAHGEDRPAIFAAQFALSHVCWLVTYPIAGWFGQEIGLPCTMLVLGVLGLVGVVIAVIVWPADDPAEIAHDHPELPPEHPHLAEHKGQGGAHAHAYIIDDDHRTWPRSPAYRNAEPDS